MIDKFVFRLERFAFAGTVLPITGMVPLLWAPDVFYCYMSDYFVHGAKSFSTGFSGLGGILVYPHTRVLLLDRGPHVPEEGPCSVGMGVHVHVKVI